MKQNIKIKALALHKYLDCVLDATPDEIDTLLKYHSEAYTEALKEEFNQREEFTKELVDGDYMFFAFIHDYSLIVAYTKYVENGKFIYTIENIAVSLTSEEEADELKEKLIILSKHNENATSEIADEIDEITVTILDLEMELEEVEDKIVELLNKQEMLENQLEDYEEHLCKLEKELDDQELETLEIPSLYKIVFLHEDDDESECECGCDCKCKH